MDVNGQSWDSKTGSGAPHRSSQSTGLHPFVASEVSRITSTSFHGRRAPASIIPLLPQCWTSLRRLAQLNRSVLERLIEQGTVHPGLTLLEVRELVARFNGQPRSIQSAGRGVRQRVERFREFVLGNCADWSPGQRQWTRDELLLLAHQLETSNGLHPPQSQTEGVPS